MIEAEAREWLYARYSTDRVDRLAQLALLVIAESAQQNLIAPSTIDMIWTRHIVDSAQLVALGNDVSGNWIDIGTGAGFPGLVVACLIDRPVILVEPRARRAAFLERAAGTLGVSASVSVCATKISSVHAMGGVLSARAVAPLPTLFEQALHCADSNTLWLLPKGRSAAEEVAQAKQTWHGLFHVEHSVTDPDGLIVVASKVSRR